MAFNIKALLSLNTAAFTNGINKAANSVLNFSSKMSSMSNNVVGNLNYTGVAANKMSKNMSDNFKDVSKVVSGILISQSFYRTFNAIKNTTGAIFEMGQAIENTQTSFAFMFRNNDLAKGFTKQIEDLAARTPYSFDQAASAAKRLLAMGIPKNQTMTYLNPIVDAAALSQDYDALEKISRALGQIHTKGRLASQEVLQLTEAGVPAFEILQQKLHLTSKQMADIGHQGIAANVAIAALLEGITERYGGASRVLQKTMTGALNTAKDNFLFLSADLTKGLYNSIKGFVVNIGNALQNLRDIDRKGGIGAVFEHVIPKNLHLAVREFIGYTMELGKQFKGLLIAFGPIIKETLKFALLVSNMLLPVLTYLVGFVGYLARAFTSLSPMVRLLISLAGGLLVTAGLLRLFTTALRSLFVIKIAISAITGLANAFRYLLLAIMGNPVALGIAAIAGAIAVVAANSEKARGALLNLFNTFAGLFKIDTSKIFAPKTEENIELNDSFNDSLGVTQEEMEGVGEKAKKAAKKIKDAILSFDEVFTLPDPDEKDDADALDDTYSVPSVPLPKVDMSQFEMPDFSGITDGISKTFSDKLLKSFKNVAIGALIGGAIGAGIGGLIGGPEGALLGAKIGALAGGIIGYFWDDMSEQMQRALKDGAIGGIVGAVIGFCIGGPGGAAIGAGIGTLVGALVGWFWDDLKKAFKSDAGQGATLGGFIGAALGLAFGNPLVGAAIGAAVGGVLGANKDKIMKWAKETKDGLKGWWHDTKTGFDDWCKSIGYNIAKWHDENIQGVTNWIRDTKNGFDRWWSDTKSGFNNWKTNISSGINSWRADTKAGLTNWWNETTTGFTNWWNNTKNGFNTWKTNTFSGISSWWADTKKGFTDWASSTNTGLGGWVNNTLKLFSNWKGLSFQSIGQWAADTKVKFDTWKSDTESKFNNWANNTAGRIGKWGYDTVQNIASWSAQTVGHIFGWKAKTEDHVNSWGNNTAGRIGKWGYDTVQNIASWSAQTVGHIFGWKAKTEGDINSWGNNTAGRIGKWGYDTVQNFASWAAQSAGHFFTWKANTEAGANEWGKNVFRHLVGWIVKAIEVSQKAWAKFKEFLGLGGGEANINYNGISQGAASIGNAVVNSAMSISAGHASGGVFNREHIARFAEGNKAEAIIPLENASAMKPFVDAVAQGLAGPISSIVAQVKSNQYNNSLPPVYVGTLIADDRSLKELERRMRIVSVSETNRRNG